MRVFRKALFFFEKAERKKLALVFFCILLVGILEVVGIASILPFLAVMSKPEVIQTNPQLSILIKFLHITDVNEFMLFLGVMVFVVLVVGNAFSATTSWLTMKFCYDQGKKISCQLLKKYVGQPYVYFLNHHRSELAHNILSEVERLVTGVFLNSIQSLTKLVILISTLLLLLVVKPFLALTIIVGLGSIYVIFYRVIRKKLISAGATSSSANTLRHQLIHEMMGAIKELKISGREQKFLDEYRKNTEKYVKAEVLCQFSPLITKHVVEAIAFGGMLLIALYLIGTKEDFSKFMPLLGMYALAGYRLMPAMQQLFSGFTSLRYHLSAFNIIYEEMQLRTDECSKNTSEKIHFDSFMYLNNVCYRYPASEKMALKNISFKVRKHFTIGFVGASGAGKTTLVDIILGLLSPTQGELLIDSVKVEKQNIPAWQRNIGYVPQNIFLLDDTLTNNIALGVNREDVDMDLVKKAARLANLHEFISQDLPYGYETYVGEAGIRLSGGQRQRVGIARALYHDPELLIFDEATSALDGVTEKIIMEAIHSLSHRKTIILIAHRLNTVKECDVIYILNNGEIVGEGTYQELLHSSRAFQHLANA
jgi:ATP-binding cassette, subfamily B, bacterial PglK